MLAARSVGLSPSLPIRAAPLTRRFAARNRKPLQHTVSLSRPKPYTRPLASMPANGGPGPTRPRSRSVAIAAKPPIYCPRSFVAAVCPASHDSPASRGKVPPAEPAAGEYASSRFCRSHPASRSRASPRASRIARVAVQRRARIPPFAVGGVPPSAPAGLREIAADEGRSNSAALCGGPCRRQGPATPAGVHCHPADTPASFFPSRGKKTLDGGNRRRR